MGSESGPSALQVTLGRETSEQRPEIQSWSKLLKFLWKHLVPHGGTARESPDEEL